MDRREFLRLSAGAAALSAMASVPRAASSAPKKSIENTPVFARAASPKYVLSRRGL
jgi:hypothetical protein